MKQSFRNIFDTVDSNNNSLSYDNYVLVIEALEWKYKSGILIESIDNDESLVYWIQTIKDNRNKLNEMTAEDFTNAVQKTKVHALALGNKVMSDAISILDKFKKSFSVSYECFLQLGINFNLGISEIFNTLKERGLWEAIKSVKGLATSFISDLYLSYSTAHKEASALIFGSIDKTKIGLYLRSSTNKIQGLLNDNPNLKIILGPIIAYTLYYIWTKMIFKGEFLYDFDWTVNINAFLGDFDIEGLFSGESGIELLTWFALGLAHMFPTATWLNGDLASIFGGWGNHALAILTTIIIYLSNKYPKILERPLFIELKKKLCDRDTKMSLNQKGIDSLTKLAIKKGIYKPSKSKPCNG